MPSTTYLRRIDTREARESAERETANIFQILSSADDTCDVELAWSGR